MSNTILKLIIFLIPLFLIENASQAQPASSLKSKVTKDLNNYYGEGREFDITVNEPGEVIIRGSISSYWDKRNVQAIISRVSGVFAIRNELQVETRVVDDRILKKNIETHINDNMAILEPRKIKVQVEDGVVTLSGVVNFAREANLAEDVASWQKGVKNVLNKITVMPPEVSMTDINLTELINGMMARFFSLEKDFIQVSVMRGNVTLAGTVTSLWAKKQVAKEIRRIQGVKGVKNEIKVSPNAAKK